MISINTCQGSVLQTDVADNRTVCCFAHDVLFYLGNTGDIGTLIRLDSSATITNTESLHFTYGIERDFTGGGLGWRDNSPSLNHSAKHIRQPNNK